MPSRWSPEEHLAYVRGLPRKRVVASLVAFAGDRLLIVKPTYRDEWLLPGGVIEEGESPAAGCARESLEELGLALPLRRLVLVDHASEPGNGSGDSLHFWFTTDPLTVAQVEAITLPPDELEAFRLVTVEEALELLAPRLAVRLRAYVAGQDSDGTIYCENGRVGIGEG